MQSPVTEAAVARGSALFRGLADPSRLAILLELRKGERRVVDLATMLGLAQATVSGHLACLRDCGLVTWRPVGEESSRVVDRGSG
jgi:ArsR family transcriptional regulator, cadmium/lead-responsive transcriptional repressor